MKTTVLIAALMACGIAVTGACGGRGSPAAPTPLVSDGSSGGTTQYGEPTPMPPGLAPTFFTIVPSSGPTDGGTEVTIAGTDFPEGATVSFDDTPATDVVVVSNELITAITPAHAPGLVDVVVTTPDGEVGRLDGAFEYVESLPVPPPSGLAVFTISPSSGPTDGGTEVTIAGAGFGDGAVVIFGEAPAMNVVVASAELIIATTPAHAEGVVDVIVTNPDGQSGVLAEAYTFIAEGPPALTTITISSSGVAPKEVEVAVGSRVVFVNENSRPHDMNSDPHPEHTDCREINLVGFIQPGQSKQTAEFRTARTCGFHDHNQPSNDRLKGRIVIR